MPDAPVKTKVYIETFAGMRFYVKEAANGRHISMKPYLNVGDKVVFEGTPLFHLDQSTGATYYGTGYQFSLTAMEKFLRAQGFEVVEKKTRVPKYQRPNPSTAIKH